MEEKQKLLEERLSELEGKIETIQKASHPIFATAIGAAIGMMLACFIMRILEWIVVMVN